jgi:hypothetical protein
MSFTNPWPQRRCTARYFRPTLAGEAPSRLRFCGFSLRHAGENLNISNNISLSNRCNTRSVPTGCSPGDLLATVR